ncbi:UNVERIFIED_ORG: hypothetical protein ABIB19_003242 [Arthrobacter sp. UYEF10]
MNDWLTNLIADSVTPATDRIVDAREPRHRPSLKEVECASDGDEVPRLELDGAISL